LRDGVASITPPAKRVKRFAKLFLDPGESRMVTFKLDRLDLSFIDNANQVIVETGDFTVLVGGLSATFTLR
jgi:beta-glucosidase